MTRVIYGLSPPHQFYEDPKITDGTHFTKKSDWNRSCLNPAYLDGMQDFTGVVYAENMFAFFDMKKIRWALSPLLLLLLLLLSFLLLFLLSSLSLPLSLPFLSYLFSSLLSSFKTHLTLKQPRGKWFQGRRLWLVHPPSFSRCGRPGRVYPHRAVPAAAFR